MVEIGLVPISAAEGNSTHGLCIFDATKGNGVPSQTSSQQNTKNHLARESSTVAEVSDNFPHEAGATPCSQKTAILVRGAHRSFQLRGKTTSQDRSMSDILSHVSRRAMRLDLSGPR